MKDGARETLLRYSKLLHKNGLVSSSDGNLSFRLPEGGFIVTPSGIPKRELSRDLLVMLDGKGNSVSGKPSSEWKLHYEIYKKRKDAGAVVHAHPPFAIALSLLGISLEDCPLSEVRIALGSVKLVPYQEPGTLNLAQNAAKALGKDGKAAILCNHGAVAVGRDIKSAYYRMEALEHASKIYYHALLLGKPKPFSPAVKKRLDQIAKIYNKE
jgi:L-fuculose-phosphate aldolase